MKKISLSLLLFFTALTASAQDELQQAKIDSIEKTFNYEHGTIALKNGIGNIIIPKGFKFLNPIQAERVLVELWGNPKDENLTMGLILREEQGVMSQNSYVFNIQYDEIGYVEDDDAEDVDYEDLLVQMKKDAEEENTERVKGGFDKIAIVGWGAKPFYDKDRKILHWAKELKFGNQTENTLNYNVRVLGRKGVLVLNAIASMKELPLVKRDINQVLDIVKFNEGYKYEDFDSSIDEVAAWTIGGLVAGKVLTKVGIFAIIAKFGKLIALSFLGFFAGFKNKIKGWFSKKKPVENDTVKLLEENKETEVE